MLFDLIFLQGNFTYPPEKQSLRTSMVIKISNLRFSGYFLLHEISLKFIFHYNIDFKKFVDTQIKTLIEFTKKILGQQFN